MVSTDQQKINEVLTRGVENLYPNKPALEKALKSGKKLRIYNGIDPTGKLHIGHGVVLLKLRQLQDLGHEVIVLFGGFTAQIGDPTDKLATRKPLTPAQIKKNTADYKKLIGKVLNTRRAKVRFLDNQVWSKKLKPADMLELASHFTVSRLLERDMFQERIKDGKEIHLHEFMYPVFQAYDSVTMDVDMEIGGNDQTFNMLAGRTLMRKMKNKEKTVLTTKLLVDPTGKKMGKTEGNMVNLDDEPQDMYGKVMSWPDELIELGFEIATNVPVNRLDEIRKELKKTDNPKDLKMELARAIVGMYHNEKAAAEAEKEFSQIFKQKLNPDDIPEMKVKSTNIIDILVETKLVPSKSEARRMIKQGGVKVDTKVVKDESYEFKNIDSNGVVLQKGKRHFVKIVN